MLRSEIISGIRSILEAIDESGVMVVLENLTRVRADRSEKAKEHLSPKDVLHSYRVYMQFYENFNDAAKRIHSILNLDLLADTEFWSAVWDFKDEESWRNSRAVSWSLNFTTKHIPQIITLLEREPEKEEIEKEEIDKKPTAKLTTIVLENSNSSSPERLILILKSINNLYDAMAIIMGVKPDTLAVIGCDSGSNKAFDFRGVGEVIKPVKELILGLFDRVVFLKENKKNSQLELMLKTLPAFDNIAKLEQDKKIPPELAEKLRRQIMEGLLDFHKVGAVIPEFQERVMIEPTRLMAPEPKLLVAPVEHKKTKEVTVESISEEIEEEEFEKALQEAAEKILQEKRKKKTPKKK